MMRMARVKDVLAWSESKHATQVMVNGVATIFSESWLEGAEITDTINIGGFDENGNEVLFHVKQAPLQ